MIKIISSVEATRKSSTYPYSLIYSNGKAKFSLEDYNRMGLNPNSKVKVHIVEHPVTNEPAIAFEVVKGESTTSGKGWAISETRTFDSKDAYNTIASVLTEQKDCVAFKVESSEDNFFIIEGYKLSDKEIAEMLERRENAKKRGRKPQGASSAENDEDDDY